MIYNERDIRNQTVKRLAEAVMAAARTAPKAKGERSYVYISYIKKAFLPTMEEGF